GLRGDRLRGSAGARPAGSGRLARSLGGRAGRVCRAWEAGGVLAGRRWRPGPHRALPDPGAARGPRVGAGGMGAVFLGRADDGDRVAVKVLRPELAGDPSFLRMFRHEVAAARRVVGFGMPKGLDADTSASLPYLVTE